MAEAEVLQTAPQAALPYAAGFFDAVYCLSVFTHLDERMMGAWLGELKRVLKPGGILLFTVHGERAAAGLDKRSAEKFDREGFHYRYSRKLHGIVPDWYNTTWHSRNYIVARVQAISSEVRYTVIADGTQDFVAARVPVCNP